MDWRVGGRGLGRERGKVKVTRKVLDGMECLDLKGSSASGAG